MRNRHRHSSPVDRLRLAVDCLPVATRRAMLEGVQANERIIVGAYTDGQGGAYAARLLGVPACVVLPIGVPLAKLTAIQRAGAETVLTGESYDEAHAAALEIARERKRSYVHAFGLPAFLLKYIVA